MKIDARRMLTGRRLLVTAVAAGVLAGGGTTAAFAVAHADPSPSASPSDGRHDGRPEAAEAAVSIAQAADAALKAVPGTVAEVELEDENGRTVWEVDVLSGSGERRDVTVDAGDGKVLANRADDRGGDRGRDGDHRGGDDGDHRGGDDGDGGAAALRGAKVAAPAAVEAALKAVPGRATSAEFEHEGGKADWKVRVTGEDGARHGVIVDAATGEILAKRTAEKDGRGHRADHGKRHGDGHGDGHGDRHGMDHGED
ncbi:PepSY domain-containing protein [Actinomadura monticuli]|uniref:PepSY domain-containing protein n=1 Tax=Actinomadura monticuli TaxID=3097367 RepID=A0ABV4QIN3_9ACTN